MNPDLGIVIGAVGASFGIAMTIAKLIDRTVGDEVKRSRQHIHDHAQVLSAHNGRIMVLESSINDLKLYMNAIREQNTTIIAMLRNGDGRKHES